MRYRRLLLATAAVAARLLPLLFALPVTATIRCAATFAPYCAADAVAGHGRRGLVPRVLAMASIAKAWLCHWVWPA